MQKALGENETIRNEIRRKAEEDMPILAECGGYLYLLKELKDENGTGYEMAGVFSGKGYKKGKKFSFRLYYGTDRKGQSVFKSRRDHQRP